MYFTLLKTTKVGEERIKIQFLSHQSAMIRASSRQKSSEDQRVISPHVAVFIWFHNVWYHSDCVHCHLAHHKFPVIVFTVSVACSRFSTPALDIPLLPLPTNPSDHNKLDDASACCSSAPLPQLPAPSACISRQIAAAHALIVSLPPTRIQPFCTEIVLSNPSQSVLSAITLLQLYSPYFFTPALRCCCTCCIQLFPSNTTAPLKPATKSSSTFCNHLPALLGFLLLPPTASSTAL